MGYPAAPTILVPIAFQSFGRGEVIRLDWTAARGGGFSIIAEWYEIDYQFFGGAWVVIIDNDSVRSPGYTWETSDIHSNTKIRIRIRGVDPLESPEEGAYGYSDYFTLGTDEINLIRAKNQADDLDLTVINNYDIGVVNDYVIGLT